MVTYNDLRNALHEQTPLDLVEMLYAACTDEAENPEIIAILAIAIMGIKKLPHTAKA